MGSTDYWDQRTGKSKKFSPSSQSDKSLLSVEVGESAITSEERADVLVEKIHRENTRVILDSKEFVAYTILINPALKNEGGKYLYL